METSHFRAGFLPLVVAEYHWPKPIPVPVVLLPCHPCLDRTRWRTRNTNRQVQWLDYGLPNRPCVLPDGPGGVAAGRGARGQPALGGDQPGAGADRDPAAVRAAVLRARGHGEPHQGAAAGPVRGGAAGGVATTRAGGDGAGAGAVRDDPGAAAEGGRGGAGERAEGLGVVVRGVSAPGAVRAQPGAVAGGDAGIACGPAGETAGAPRAAASGRCVHPAPIRRAGRAECPGTGPG